MELFFDKLAELNFLELGISFVLGGILSWVFGHYYFRRSVKKSLWVEVKSAFRVFEEFGENLVTGLEVLHEGKPVKDLFLIDLDVTNKSDRPIRDPIRPLAFTFPNASLLDAFLLKKHPEQNEVVTTSRRELNAAIVQCNFDLLNPGDSFSCRLMFDGKVNVDLITGSITADDLPAQVRIRAGVGMVTKKPNKLKLWDWVGISLLCAFVGIPIFMVGVVVMFNDSRIGYKIWGYSINVDLFGAVGIIPAVIGSLFLIILIVGIFNIAKQLLSKLIGSLAEFINRIQRSETDL